MSINVGMEKAGTIKRIKTDITIKNNKVDRPNFIRPFLFKIAPFYDKDN